ncbi:MAG: polyprenyl synthetase family protein [Eubacteriales bacterium]|nr:polyprenyl synthetase family protein [Eubacteriales bacterium]
MNFKEELQKKTEEVQKTILRYLPKEEGFASNLAAAMNYSMKAGGKRLRPILMKETYAMFGGTGEVIEPFMVGMEMIHTHSLIHDDLPALDNDEYRRGKKTTHVVFGEAMGILSGDALLNYAYEVLFHAFDLSADNERVVLALQILAAKTGIYGMLGGQSVDVENDGKPLSLSMLEYIYKNKTSALIEASMMVGAILAGADDGSIRTMEQIGYLVGIAFQIQDDILDVTSTSEELGKPVGSDEKNHKTTYVTLVGLDAALQEVERLSREALSLLDGLEEKNPFLYQLVEELVHRRK